MEFVLFIREELIVLKVIYIQKGIPTFLITKEKPEEYVELVKRNGRINTMPIYDTSSLQSFKDCPERYRLRNILGLKKIEEGIDEHDRNFGKAIHSALEAYYKGKELEVCKSAFKTNYPEQLSVDDFAKTQENGLILIEAYAKHYKEEDKQFEVLDIEVTDSFKFLEIEFTVKIDLIIKKQGCIYFVDHKTTGKPLNWTYWSRFEPNPQITAYTAYCQTKYRECSGGIINAIRFGHRQRSYKGEPAGFYYEFQRQLFNRNKDQVESWKVDTLNWVKRLEEAKLDTSNVWRKNEGQCGYCSYREICISFCDEQIINQLYERIDNPMEYLYDNNQRANKSGNDQANS